MNLPIPIVVGEKGQAICEMYTTSGGSDTGTRTVSEKVWRTFQWASGASP
jgi:hypothetical protein